MVWAVFAAGGGSRASWLGITSARPRTSPSRSVSGRMPGSGSDRTVALQPVSVSESDRFQSRHRGRGPAIAFGALIWSRLGGTTDPLGSASERRASRPTVDVALPPDDRAPSASGAIASAGDGACPAEGLPVDACRSRRAKAWINATSSRLAKRPSTSRCPVRMLVTSTMRASFVLIARILATHFAGSQ